MAMLVQSGEPHPDIQRRRSSLASVGSSSSLRSSISWSTAGNLHSGLPPGNVFSNLQQQAQCRPWFPNSPHAPTEQPQWTETCSPACRSIQPPRSISSLPSMSSVALEVNLPNQDDACCSRHRDRCFSCLRRFAESEKMSAIMFLLTFIALFSDSIRLVAFDRSADSFFDALTFIVFTAFMWETIISSVGKSDYFLSFFFWLDIVSAVSLVLDLTFVNESLLGQESLSSASEKSGSSPDSHMQESEYARACRSARLGARVARILRILRLIRVSRIFRVYLWCQAQFGGESQAGKATPGNELESDSVRTESRVGRKLSDRTTCWLTSLVVTMLAIVPALDPEEATTMAFTSSQYGTDVIDQAWSDYKSALHNERLDETVREFRRLWEEQVLMFLYYHNPHSSCTTDRSQQVECASNLLHKICYIGYLTRVDTQSQGIGDAAVHATGQEQEEEVRYIKELSRDVEDWEVLFQNSLGTLEPTKYWTGDLPADTKKKLASPWTTLCREKDLAIYGVSLLPNMACPWQKLRTQESIWYFPLRRRPSNEAQLVVFFDVRAQISWQAGMSMLQTTFLALVLSIGAVMFSRDSDRLVLHPIERMMSMVERIRQDPFYAIDVGCADYKSRQRKVPDAARHAHVSGRNSKKATLETKILENVIIKLGALLAIGFGVAGSEIIRDVLDDSSMTFNARTPGRKIQAIFGVCKIQSFAEMTIALKEKTMVFVNLVAEIVHRVVVDHLGAPNKSLGEAFLLVWRLGKYTPEARSKIPDLSVLALVSINAMVSRDARIDRLWSHPMLVGKIGRGQVTLGFGLHLGWSIEGAIGSQFKIDASYTSSHVNMAMRVEEMTKEHKVSIIVTDSLLSACSQAFASHFRAIDRVDLAAVKRPVRLFTLDLDKDSVFISHRSRDKNSLSSFQSQEQAELAVEEKLQIGFDPHEIFMERRDIQRMRWFYTLEFFQMFEKGFLNYEAGEWGVAAEAFYTTRCMLRDRWKHADWVDGPSDALLSYMEAFRFQAPPTWSGFRKVSDRPHGDQDRPLFNPARSLRSTDSDEYQPCDLLRKAARLRVEPHARPIDDLPRLLSSPDVFHTEFRRRRKTRPIDQEIDLQSRRYAKRMSTDKRQFELVLQPPDHLEDALSESDTDVCGPFPSETNRTNGPSP